MKKVHSEAGTKKRTKPSHNTLQNVIWMLHNAWKSCRTVPLWCVVLAALTVGLNLAELFVAPRILQKVETSAPVGELLATIAGFAGLLFVLTGLKQYVTTFSQWGQIEVRMGLLRAITGKVLRTSYPNRLDVEAEGLFSKANQTTGGNNMASEEIWRTLTRFLTNLGGFAVYLLMLSHLDPILLGVVLVSAAASFLATRWANAWQYRNEDQTFWEKWSYIRVKSESLETAKDIRVFGLADWLLGLQEKLMRFWENWAARVEYRRLAANAVDILFSAARNGAAYFYLIHIALRDGLPASTFLLYFTAVSGFTAWITGILNDSATLHRQALELNYIRDYLNLPEPFRMEGGTAIPAAETYALKLENVSYRYPGAETDALHNVSLTIHPREKLAIVGLNGAGKTTLVKLLCGLIDPTEGRVLLNGQDIRAFNRPDYYRMYSAVFQDYSLLDVTVAENVAQACESINRTRVAACLEQSGLKEKVASLPLGLDAHVGRDVWEDGVLLSGGETQRLLLARALYKDAPILLLDEPTAALDPLAENDIYMKYNEMTAGRTAMFISHRLASTRFCDRIIFVAEGGIAEEGTHEALLKKGGKYADLFEAQSRYYREGRDF